MAALWLLHVHPGVCTPYSLIVIFKRKEYRSETMHKAFLSLHEDISSDLEMKISVGMQPL